MWVLFKMWMFFNSVHCFCLTVFLGVLRHIVCYYGNCLLGTFDKRGNNEALTSDSQVLWLLTLVPQCYTVGERSGDTWPREIRVKGSHFFFLYFEFSMLNNIILHVPIGAVFAVFIICPSFSLCNPQIRNSSVRIRGLPLKDCCEYGLHCIWLYFARNFQNRFLGGEGTR